MRNIYYILFISLFLYSSSSKGDTIAQCAHEQLGKPYKYGGIGPYQFDSFGLIYYCMKLAGLPSWYDREMQAKQGKQITAAELVPGDTVYLYDKRYNLIGAFIYYGNGLYIYTYEKVISREINFNPEFHYDYRRNWE